MDKLTSYLRIKNKEGVFGEEAIDKDPIFIKTDFGEINRNDIFQIGNKKVTIKSKNIKMNSQSNLEREYNILNGLVNYKIGSPTPYLFNPNFLGRQILVIEYINGASLDKKRLIDYTKSIAVKIKELHQLKIDAQIFDKVNFSSYSTYWDFIKEIQAYVSEKIKKLERINLNNRGLKTLEKIVNKSNLRVEEKRRFFSGSNFSFCHKDFKPKNIVLDSKNRLRLIDWEYANICDPAFDIASFFRATNLSFSNKSSFTEEYGNINSNFTERVESYLEYGLAPSLLWHIDRLFNSAYGFNKEKNLYYKKGLGFILGELYKSKIIGKEEINLFI
jgi:thiamine kinase-like enzyme